ncbi:MAG: type II toxin-antitoxin system HicB family antitoxin [Methanomicrobiales archaeon]|nr:type II toxin-antitoxin system HicB family antitoxin [Methanomicrobiales archaeon]
MKQFKIIIEQHPDGFIAYPVGMKGIVIGPSDTYQEALEDIKSAIVFHLETFGKKVFSGL